MAEFVKKRSRKSKLVPRIYDLDDCINEDDVGSTSEKAKPSKLLKIKLEHANEDYNSDDFMANPLQNYMSSPLQNYMTTTPENYTQSSPMEFSIKVEVEEFNELEIKEEPDTAENIPQNSKPSISDFDINKEADMLLMQAENIDLNTNSLQDCSNSQMASELSSDTSQDLVIDEPQLDQNEEGVKYYSLSLQDILNYQPDPTDVAGKMLCVEIRNYLGRLNRFYGMNDPVDRHNKLIQAALGDKKITLTPYRDIIFMYKCYICDKAWWHLHPFQDHIKQHNAHDLMVSLEEEPYKNNLVAYIGEIPYRELEIESDCCHCGKAYSDHKMFERKGISYFTCKHCEGQFYTCIQLMVHEGGCYWRQNRSSIDEAIIFNCRYCSTMVFSESDMNKHLVLRHSVRSDTPMPKYFKLCPYCKEKYYNFNLHTCQVRSDTQPCVFCNRKFRTKILWDSHISLYKTDVDCPICDDVLPKECMMSEHLLQKHSDDFQFVSKCMICPGFIVFTNEDCQKEHRLLFHRNNCDTRGRKLTSLFDLVLVPKKLMINPIYKYNEGLLKQPFGCPTRVIPIEPEAPHKCGPKHKATIQRLSRRIIELPEPTASTSTAVVKGDIVTDISENNSIINELSNKITSPPDSKVINKKNKNIVHVELIKIKNEIEDIDSTVTDNVQESNIVDIKEEIQDAEALNDDEYQNLLSNVFKMSENYEKPNAIKLECDEVIPPLEEDINISKFEPEVILRQDLRRIYKCNKCGYKNYHREYKLHLENKCKKIENNAYKTGDYLCTKCNNSYNSFKSYLKHFVHHNFSYLSCPECSEVFDTIFNLKAHVNHHIRNSYVKLLVISRTKNQSKVFQCKKCKGKVTLNNFFAHWESHLDIDMVGPLYHVVVNEKHVSTALEPDVLKELLFLLVSSEHGCKRLKEHRCCVVCRRHFERVNDCKRHFVEHLLVDAYANKPTNNSLKCQICSEGFRKADAYKQHMRDHGSLPIYKCELCDKTFSDSSNFTKHKKIHNLRVHICDICGKKFQAKISIEKHMQMHLVTDPIECTHCSKIFHSESSYKKHVRGFHNKHLPKFKCSMCTKRFLCLKDKWDHLWLVHKERTHQADCPVCEKSFRKYSDVKAHVKSEHNLGVTVFNMKLFDTEEKRQMAEALQLSLNKCREECESLGKDETLIVFE